MKKFTTTLLACSMILLLGSCGGKESKEVDSTAIKDSIARVEAEAAEAAAAAEQARLDSIRQDSIRKAEKLAAQKAEEDEQVMAVLRTLYIKYFMPDDYVNPHEYASKYFSKKLMDKLVDPEDADPMGPAYPELADYEGGPRKFISITPEGNNWYRVKYSLHGNTLVQISLKGNVVDGKVVISDYKKR